MRRPGFHRWFTRAALLFLAMSAAITWVPITEADVLTQISGDELTAYREAALADGQADPVQPAIDQVTEDVRGYVAGCRQNKIGPDGTIPKRLMRDAVAMVVVAIPARVRQNPKEVRKDAAKASLEKLKLVASCKYAIADPGDDQEATTESESTPTPSFSGRDRRDARRERNGL